MSISSFYISTQEPLVDQQAGVFAAIGQSSTNCLFCNIVSGIAPSRKIAENDDVLIFESVRPRYPSHFLIIPKKHIKDLKSAQLIDLEILGKLLMAAHALGTQLAAPQAFNIAINEGSQAGQTVFHLHLHFHSQSKLITNKPAI